MRMRRLLAVLLLLSMLVSVVPTSVFAVETENGSDGETAATAVDPSTAPSDNLFVDKTVTLTEDGTYSINMEAYATGTPITKTVELGVPLDVVLVVDQSGSLKNSGSVDFMKNSIRDFMNALKANGEAVGVDHRVSICSFAGDDLAGLSGPADETYGYSFAGDLWDLAWLNTGLYVDGKFQDYGTVEYTRIDSLDKLDTTRYYLVKYTRTLENGSSVAEYFRIYYYTNYGSWYIHNGKQGLVGLATRKQDGNDKNTSEDLIANYEVYDIGESTLQLDQADYAASWEYIADGQGNLNADVAAAINSLASNGGTRTSYGLKMARNMLKYITPGTDNDIRKKVVVVFTDGKAGAGWNSDGEMAATLAEANKIKASGVDIYTVGVYSDAVATDIASFMNQFSSNCGLIGFSENPTTEYEYNNLGQNTWVSSVTGRYRTLPSFYKVENEDGTVEFCPVRVCVETRYTDAAKDWVVTPPYKWTYITDTGEMPIPAELLNEDGTAITGLYKIGSGDYNSEAGYYQASNSFDNLSSLFQTVLDKETIFYSEVELGTTAILKDVLADGFTLTDNTQITVSVVPGSVSKENSNLSPNELTRDKITWSEEAQQVLTMNAKEKTAASEPFVVTGAFDQTEMTLTATAENGEINVTGYNYAAQFISKDHVGSKLVVTITGVEAVTGVTTNAATSTNKATSGVYEGPESDADKDGIPGEIETPFPVPNTYLTSEYYYLDETGKVTFEIKDFLMDEGIHISDGHHIFTPAEPGTTLATEYGTATVNTDGTVTYQLKEGMKPEELEKDIIYLFGKTKDPTVTDASANANGNMWSEITILPPKDAVGKLHTDKSATLMGDGTYTIDLEAFATGTPALATLSTKQPLDVVLVIDQSGSLCEFYKTENAEGKKVYEWNRDALEALKGSVSSFVHELQANADANGLNHRISICGFGSDEFIGWSVGREYLHDKEAELAKEQGTELPEPSKGVENCYTYAGDLEGICFTNTGLFVNGEFKKYGTIKSERFIVNTIDDVVDNEVYIANEKGTDRYIPVTYYPKHSAWRVWASDGWWTFFNKDTKEENVWEFLKKYDLYTLPREITVQLTDKDYQNSWETVSVNGNLNPDIAKTIDSLAGNGATFISYGMRMARHMLENAPDPNDEEGVVRKKVVIVFTDGCPGGTSLKNAGEAEAALAEAQQIKNGLVDKNGKAIKAEIYTVGIYNGETERDDEFMNLLSSNCASHTFSELEPQTLDNKAYVRVATNDCLFIPKYFYKLEKGNGDVEYCPIKVYWKSAETGYEWYYITDEGLNRIPSGTVTHRTITGAYKLESGEYNPDLGYYSNSDNFSDLPGLFREIVTDVSTYSSEVQLDAKAILKDVMADGFTLTNNTQITVSVVPGSVKEEFADVGANRLGSEHISWVAPQEVLTFKYSEAKEGTGNVIVNGAADQTEMTLSAQVTEDGIITVTGFNYASPADNHKENAQYICAGHPGSKLVVTITGVEAKNGVTTDSLTVTNKGASGIYEASDSDLDGDGTFGEMQAYFPIPTTYLSSKTYYVDYSGELIIDPADFLMTIEGYSLDKNGYHGFGAPDTTIELDHGTVTVLNDGKLKFTMKSDGLDITDTFYLFGHTDNATVKAAMANTTGNMWSKVTIITPEDITGKLFLDKEATLTDDGTYTIDLNAYATGMPVLTTITEGVPLDASSILKDVMADGFALTDNTTITVSVVPGSVKEKYANLTADELTSDKITWGEPQQVLTFQYSTAEGAENTGSGDVIVNDAADKTKMTLTAKVTEDGIITVDGFNYAGPKDSFYVDAQYIRAGHAGSKLMVTITGVEAKTDVVTDSVTTTNNGTSGIYESEDSDLDKDGETGELQASFPIPTTYLTSEFYYLDKNNSVTINPKDFLMTVKGINADPDGYNFFDVNNPGTKVETEHGTVTVNEDGTVTYQLTNTDWENEDIFYLFGKTEDPTVTDADANKDGNMWSEITILPPKDASGKLHTDKSATLMGDGTYTIDLEAFATGTPASTIVQEGIPLDVVLVIDQSGSLFTNNTKYDGVPLQMLKESVTEFVETLKANGEAYGVNHRISMCGFASGELSGASGTTAGGYSYASDMRYNSWLNTGLFVDGEFREYAKMNYIRINDPSELDVNRYYTVKFDPKGDGNYEYVSSLYSEGRKSFRYWDGKANSKVVGGDNKEDIVQRLLDSYEVYKHGKSTVQLDDPDYAASWEYLATDANGQGSINPDILKSINKLASNGLTNTFYGMMMASRMLENAPNDGIQRKKVVIVFTDGEPGSNGYVKGDGDAALSAVRAIKDAGAEVYTVGIYSAASEAKVNTFMNHLSSNYKSHSFTTTPTRIDMSQVKTNTTGNTRLAGNIDSGSHGISPYYKMVGDDYWPVVISTKYETPGVYYASYITDRAEEGGVLIGYGDWDKIPEIVGDVYMLAEPEINENRVTDYYKYSGDINELSAMFREIVTNTTNFSSQVSLGADAILKDVMADGFKLTDNTTITVSVVPGSVKEEHANLDPDKLTEAHIDWFAPQQVLSFKYSTAEGAENTGTGKVIVNGAADQTEMTLTAKVDENGVITVTGYNYADPADNHKEKAQYICAGHPGSKLVVTITGVEAKSDIVTDSVTVTNKGTSGIYEGPNSDMDGDGVKGEIQSSFPVPTTYMASKVYVVDYAKTMTINPSDFKMTVGAVSVDVDGYNHFDPAVTAATHAYGNVTVEDGKITYTPTKTNWNGYDSFYVFGTTDNATIKAATANENGNMWAKVSVVPANNVYYEDTFVTNESTGVVGIVFGGDWEEVKEAVDAGANGENAESGESTTKDDQGNDHQGGVHGWEDSLADDTGFSDGSAHIANTVGATATFTFSGTGVDIYSRTNKETGMVLAMLYEGTSTTDENGKNLVAKYTLMVDNLAASGDYYQVPTLSFCQIPLKIDGKIQKDENGNTIMTDLPYGTYTVKIIVSKVGASQTGSERFLYYLDGIRVYNPIQNQESDSIVSGAYGEEELNANFVEIRDKLLDANSFSAEIDESAGPVFIDRITSEDGSHTDNTKTVEIGTYKVFGPKNEVYLSANQIVAFAVPYTEGAHYYIGMKSLTGKTVKVITNSTDDYVNLIVVGHTTDLYYEVIPEWEYDEYGNPTTGIIFVHSDITNGDYKMDEDGNYITDENGNYITEVDGAGAILALTKLKVTGPEAKNFKFARVSNSKLLEMIAEDLAPSLDMDDTNSSPDVGGNTPNKPNEDINEPGSDTTVDEQTALKNLMIDLLTRIFSDLRGWFKP